jgi:RecJ-like exonuclease
MLSVGRGFLSAIAVVLLAALPGSAQGAVTLSGLVHNPNLYDGDVVRVAGTVADYRERVSSLGKPYTIFRLRDGSASVAVLAWSHQGLHEGLRVEVTGAFVKVKTYMFIKAQRTVVL